MPEPGDTVRFWYNNQHRAWRYQRTVIKGRYYDLAEMNARTLSVVLLERLRVGADQ